MADRVAEISRKTNETLRPPVGRPRRHRRGGRRTPASGFSTTCWTCWPGTALIDLKVEAVGDLHVDAHHTAEDVGIVFGQAIDRAVGDKRGIHRYGWAIVPMDESLAQVAVDLSGRPAFVYSIPFRGELDRHVPRPSWSRSSGSRWPSTRG